MTLRKLLNLMDPVLSSIDENTTRLPAGLLVKIKRDRKYKAVSPMSRAPYRWL